MSVIAWIVRYIENKKPEQLHQIYVKATKPAKTDDGFLLRLPVLQRLNL